MRNDDPTRTRAVLRDGSFDPVAHNRAAWDREVDSGNEWTRPVGPRRSSPGRGSVTGRSVLIGYQPVAA